MLPLIEIRPAPYVLPVVSARGSHVWPEVGAASTSASTAVPSSPTPAWHPPNSEQCREKVEPIDSPSASAPLHYRSIDILTLAVPTSPPIRAVSFNFKKAARKPCDDATALETVGICFHPGKVVRREVEVAVGWYRMASSLGNVHAQAILGGCYYSGVGTAIDCTKAASLFRSAGEHGHSGAQTNLGYLYSQGEGVQRDRGAAAQWWRLAASQNVPEAQHNLAVSFDVGGAAEAAVKWYKLAAQNGVAGSQSNLAMCYYTGRGVGAKDLKQAVGLWQLAAGQGLAAAQNALGVCSLFGQGCKKNFASALSWYEQAAAQGLVAAQYNLAVCYRDGEPVNVAAAPLPSSAKGKGAGKAKGKAKPRTTAKKGKTGPGSAAAAAPEAVGTKLPMPADQAVATKWFELAAEQGNPLAVAALQKIVAAADAIGKSGQRRRSSFKAAACVVMAQKDAVTKAAPAKKDLGFGKVVE
jgi:uncharacterized protein